MTVNIPPSQQKRLVIIGSGFAGLKLAQKLKNSVFQIVLIDKYNYHQFQPLFYQVATSGIEPSAISFPLRKIFQKVKNVFIRITEVTFIDTKKQVINTNLGDIYYDYLVVATGANTSYFGMKSLEEHSLPMKTTEEALNLRNSILQNFEDALSCKNEADKEGYLNIAVVGGGPTGVEVSGALAEMKKFVIPKDFKELDSSKIHIYLLEAADKLLNGMSEIASLKAKIFLKSLGVEVITNTAVTNYDGKTVELSDGKKIISNTLIWTAGIKGNIINGLNPDILGKGNRIKVNKYNQIQGYENIFALGDIALMTEEKYPNGHPQVAQVAVQQARLLAKNLLRIQFNKPLQPFKYKNLGSMATIGRNRAVVDFPFVRFQGIFAWFVWMFVHLMSIVGVKNRLLLFINWFWNYVTYDQSLRLIIRTKK